jgi:hypothetical protein
MTEDTILTLEEQKEIEAIRAKNEYYSLEDVMTYLRMRDTIAQDTQVIEHA